MTTTSPDVLIIGGGVAGLAAAVELTSHGHSILLIEQKQHLGGRTYSFRHPETGGEVDNGQHLLMGCYHATLRYLKMIGAENFVEVQDTMSVIFRAPDKSPVELKTNRLPAPLNVLWGLFGLSNLSFVNRLKLLRVGIDVMLKDPDTNRHLHSISVSQWLEELGQPEENRKYLWDIIAIGALNDSLEKVSAALFAKVIKTAFFGSRKNASMVIPKNGLSTVLVDKAIEFIEKRGGKILLNTSVERFHDSGFPPRRAGRIQDVVLSNGNKIQPTTVISAVPYFDIPRVFGEYNPLGMVFINEFESSPIVTLHLWFDAHFMKEKFCALLDSPIHWVFNKSMMYGNEDNGLMYLSLVVSGAHDLVEKEKEELVELGHNELKRFYPAASVSKIIHSLVIKEKRATFSPKVGIEQFRPSHKTSIENLFLAGDWTDTKLPATIEGAVQSGFECAGMAVKYLDQN
ncbi:MAG: FAD-dependent oxidoreductase [Ignavibacteriales bacterium]|nr:FAD-dependent oxidoreductase [Ignavibacteriales bacterium]